jgi:hypothetical protein
VLLDLLANNNWKRPVYFATTTGDDAYIGLMDYLQLEGIAYRLVPYKMNKVDEKVGGVNSDVMYDNLMNKFAWGNMNNTGVYLDETNMRMATSLRIQFARLATALIVENKTDKAIKVCDKCIEVMPDNCVPYDLLMLPFINVYYKAGKTATADNIAQRLVEYADQELNYYSQFKGSDAAYLSYERKDAVQMLENLYTIALNYNQTDLATKIQKLYQFYEKKTIPKLPNNDADVN